MRHQGGAVKPGAMAAAAAPDGADPRTHVGATLALRSLIKNALMSPVLKHQVAQLLAQGADLYGDLVDPHGDRGANAFQTALQRLNDSPASELEDWLDVFECFARLRPSMAPVPFLRVDVPQANHVDWRSPSAWGASRVIERMARHLDPGAPAVRGMVESAIDRMTGGLVAQPDWARSSLSIGDIELTTTRLVDAEQFRRFWLEPSSWWVYVSWPSVSLPEPFGPAGVPSPRVEFDVSQHGAPNLLRWLADQGSGWPQNEAIETGIRATFASLVARLVEAGVDLSSPRSCGLEHWSPLHVAACLGEPHTVDVLLAAGVDPDLRGPAGLTPERIAGMRDEMAPLFPRARADLARRRLRYALVSPAAPGAASGVAP